MSERGKHLFSFRASEIARAAREAADYHRERAEHWERVLDEATATVERTARIKVTRQEQTGGWLPIVGVEYGDPTAYAQMTLAARKIQTHRAAHERFASDATLYGTQTENGRDRDYELDADDVAHFRLAGQERET